MADEGASSSSNSGDEVGDGAGNKFSKSFTSHPADNSCSTVSSSGTIAASSQGLVELSRLSSNPFAIKSSTPTRSLADTTENKEPRPIIAPPTLKLDTSAPTVILRPSALAVQAEKFKSMNKHEASSTKEDVKDSLSNETSVLKEAVLKDLFFSGISTSSDLVVSSSSSTIVPENNNAFSLAAAKSDELPSNGGFVFGQNLHERVLTFDGQNKEQPSSPVSLPHLTFDQTAHRNQEANPQAPTVVLRPSALAVQAEKLKLMNKHEASSTKQEGSENFSEESNIFKKEAKFTVSESNGKASKSDLVSSGISTSSDIVVSSSSSSTITAEGSSSFSLAAAKKDQLSSNGGFVFGQNLHERVLNYDANAQRQPAPPVASSNFTFEQAVLQNQEEKVKSLAESAKEYESRQVKRKFDEVTVVTGEEGETNVLQIHCKLFAFDKEKMIWQQRGRGVLRVNDITGDNAAGPLVSRVVMRVHGSLRVVLNTKVWDGMALELPSSKSVRLSAFDPQGVKVFLVMAQPNDAKSLYDTLSCRVVRLRTGAKTADESSSKFEEATSSTPLPDDFDSPHKMLRMSENSYGADSSSESILTSQDSSAEGGCADSTNVQS